MLNIEKGQSISLVKPDGTTIQKIIVGLSWDTAEIGQNVDLDLFVIHKQTDLLYLCFSLFYCCLRTVGK